MSAAATYDLHLHTYWSHDASAHPESHFKRARQLGVQCIAITEHYSLDSLEDIRQVAGSYSEIRFIPSAELTVDTSIGEVDLLCYGFPLSPPPEMMHLLQVYADWRRDTGRALAAGLCELGCDFDEQRLMTLAKTYRPADVVDRQGLTQVGGAALRDFLMLAGHVGNDGEFGEFRARAKRIAGAPLYPAVGEVVPVVKELGAVVSIAHPPAYFNDGDRQRMDALREEIEFDAIECAHPRVPAELSFLYRDYCREHRLLSTAGSDSHTEADVESKFAKHGGPTAWMDELAERLPTPD